MAARQVSGKKGKVLLLGWDAADWKVIRPLLEAGQMPNLADLMQGGMHGNIATIYPVLSPMLWTSIATGKRAYKHGIHGFTEPLQDGSGVRPITLLGRKTKAVWNILNQTGHKSLVVGWWPSHPAEPLNGVMVSNHFQQATGKIGSPAPLPSGTIHPNKLSASLADLRVQPTELSGEFLRFFVPEFEKIDQEKDKRLHSLGKIIAETMSVHAVATELLETESWDFAAIYYSGIDHFGHAFMGYHPPRLPWVKEEDFQIYQHVIANAYRYHDAMLGTLLQFADEQTTVILMSDHGFHPDHLRAAYIPVEPAGPAVEHRHYGILCVKGPGIRENQKLLGAGLLDICPTILTLFGLQPGRDMDGKVLVTLFKEPLKIEPIESWDKVAGDAGNHTSELQMDAVASAEAFKQLVELGYVAPPGPNAQDTVDECVRELKYNLARAYKDGNCCGEAAAIAQELWDRWPKEHRFGILLLDCLGPLRKISQRRKVLEELARRINLYQKEAIAELEADAANKRVESKDQAVDDAAKKRAQFEERKRLELAHGRPVLLDWLRATQALLENKPEDAREHLKMLENAEDSAMGIGARVASALGELGELEQARTLLEASLKNDPEDAWVHAQLAGLHLESGRLDEAVAAATESLSLLYFQPPLHALLGKALMETGRIKEAEQELLVAVTQSPRNLAAHELLATLYRVHLNDSAKAFAQEGRVKSLHNEVKLRREEERAISNGTRIGSAQDSQTAPQANSRAGQALPENKAFLEIPPAFGPDVDRSSIITVVSGLPRSGTSMMMQLLEAAGKVALTDGKREADHDNPLGYFEFAKSVELARDSSWLAQARGKVVKIVAQLLPFLPSGEVYNVVFMERDLSEVLASQKAMLVRQGKTGATIETKELAEAYATQLRRVHRQIGQRKEIRMLAVNYATLVSEPLVGVDKVATFLGEPFDRAKAVASVHPELRRQKAGEGSATH